MQHAEGRNRDFGEYGFDQRERCGRLRFYSKAEALEKMSYLVLGLGVFLSLGGAIAFYAGYGIIRGRARLGECHRRFRGVLLRYCDGCARADPAQARQPASLSQCRARCQHRGWANWPQDGRASCAASLLIPELNSSAGSQPVAVPPVAAAPIPSAREAGRNGPSGSNLTAARNFLKSARPVLALRRGGSRADYSSLKAPPFSRDVWRCRNQAGRSRP